MAKSSEPMDAAGIPDGTILFDGVCVFCSRWVRFVAARDRGRYRFTPIQSRSGRALAIRFGIDPELPQTNAVVLDGLARFKSDAALAVLATLPGWSWSRAAGLAPRALRDWLYDQVARNRYRIFGRTDACMVPPPHLRDLVVSDVEA